VSADSAFCERYKHVSVSIQLSIKSQQGFNSASLQDALINVLNGLRDQQIRPGFIMRSNSNSAPLLQKHSVTVQLTARNKQWFTVSAFPFVDRSFDARQWLMDLVAKKAALSYNTKGHSLWLVLGVTDPNGQSAFDVDSFVGVELPMKPFARVIVTDAMRTTSTPLREAS
jgi:hypothetical protein